MVEITQHVPPQNPDLCWLQHHSSGSTCEGIVLTKRRVQETQGKKKN